MFSPRLALICTEVNHKEKHQRRSLKGWWPRDQYLVGLKMDKNQRDPKGFDASIPSQPLYQTTIYDIEDLRSEDNTPAHEIPLVLQHRPQDGAVRIINHASEQH
jgi:hypothetical protein